MPRHTIRDILVVNDPDGTQVLAAITDDNLEWRVRLEGVQLSFDIHSALLTLCASACERDPDVIGDFQPRVVPPEEREYLDMDPVERRRLRDVAAEAREPELDAAVAKALETGEPPVFRA